MSSRMIMIAVVVLGATAYTAACGGSTSPEGVSTDSDAGAGADANEAPDTGAYEAQGSLCCAEGAGTSCCAAAQPMQTCYATQCVGAGSELSGKDPPCLRCCDGMILIPNLTVEDGGACVGPLAVDDGNICAACGDGFCASGVENHCNCPADCP